MIVYKFYVREELQKRGYTERDLRKKLGGGAMSNLRHSRPGTLATLDALCALLNVQPGDLLAYIPNPDEEPVTPSKTPDAEKIFPERRQGHRLGDFKKSKS